MEKFDRCAIKKQQQIYLNKFLLQTMKFLSTKRAKKWLKYIIA